MDQDFFDKLQAAFARFGHGAPCANGFIDLLKEEYLRQGKELDSTQRLPVELRQSLRGMIQQCALLLRFFELGIVPITMPSNGDQGVLSIPKNSPLRRDVEFLSWLTQQQRDWEILQD